MSVKSTITGLLVLIFATPLLAQTRPLLTEDIDITPPGQIEISAGTDFFQNQRFPLSGLKGDLTRVADVRIRTGYAGNVEVLIEGVVQNYLDIDSQSANPPIPLRLDGNSTSDFGDIRTTVKIKLRNETKNLPAIGMSLGYQIPNTDQSRGIGINQTELFTKFIAQKKFGVEPGKDPKLKLYGNIGLGIINAPLENFSQNDVILYGLAGVYRVNNNVNLASEVNGRISTRSGQTPLGTESRGQFRFGSQIKASGLRFDTAAIFGLTKYSPKTGITFGVTYLSPPIFKPAQ